MKISKIKTKSEFFKFADIWYQRTKNLRNIVLDKNMSNEKRIKAHILWYVMIRRMKVITELAINVSNSKLINVNKHIIASVGEYEELISINDKLQKT